VPDDSVRLPEKPANDQQYRRNGGDPDYRNVHLFLLPEDFMPETKTRISVNTSSVKADFLSPYPCLINDKMA